ncbi:GTPase-activating protein [Martiniozyma asiatica (nom. inval.)]|nr:GTPase-activating protein [Martiniozyma asiatica]
MSSKLLYARSCVYIHPTPRKSDNIKGFLVLTAPIGTSDHNKYLIAFIPNSDLSIKDQKSLEKFDLYGIDGEYDGFFDQEAGKETDLMPKIDCRISNPKISSISSYAFGLQLRDLYSIQVRPKKTNLWPGSIVLHAKIEMDQLPVLFFHDSESPGFKREEKLQRQRFDPFSGDDILWGGSRFIKILGTYCDLKKSVEKGLFLVNSTSEDVINFIPGDSLNEEEKQQTVEKFWHATKWSVISGLASVSGFAKDKIDHLNNMLNNENTPQFIKKIFENRNLTKVGDEFDSANIYLAKWALQVQQEAEKNRKMIIGNEYYKDLIASQLGDNIIELTPHEVSKAARKDPISLSRWNNFFDSTGRLKLTVDEVLDEVFHSGLLSETRKEAWPFLLGVFPWDSSKYERDQLYKTLQNSYVEYKNNWMADVKKQNENEFWKDQKNRIIKDVRRTDRELDIFKSISNDDDIDADTETNDNLQTFKNPHLEALKNILFSYNELNWNLGYVQGMSDLLSPIYIIYKDETMAFWCFSRFMERMERNFVRDLSGMKEQMLTLTELVQFMLPNVYEHLQKCQCDNLFFFFRMLLVWFKREFLFDETLQLWEIMWTDRFSSQMILFFSLSILQKHSKIIINNLDSFEDMLKYMNDLNGAHAIGDLLTRSELLFVKFRQMIEFLDRSGKSDDISDNLRSLLKREVIIKKEEERTEETPFG